MHMGFFRISLGVAAGLLLCFAALAQRSAEKASPGFPDAPGKDVVI